MSSAPKWFMPIAIAALLWNLLGCLAYLHDVMLTPADIAAMTPEQQAMYAARPAWAVAATATAVWGGALGCIGLLLRKRWSVFVLALSLAGVIVQDVAMFAMSGSIASLGPVPLVLQGIVLVVAVWLVLLARKAARLHWIA